MKATITLTEDQLFVIREALETYARIHTGQLDIAFDRPLLDMYGVGNPSANLKKSIKDEINHLKTVMFPDLEENAGYGIYNVHNNAKIAWDIYMSIQYHHKQARMKPDAPRNSMLRDNILSPAVGPEPLPTFKFSGKTKYPVESDF